VRTQENPDETAESVAVDLHRHDIDRVDRTIVALLAERLRLALALGDIKRERGWALRSAEREAEVIARVRAAAAGPLTPEAAERIFGAIIAEMAASQERRNG
jgi:chorismate mutase